mmetsp:Transcript_12146/g.27580  ORF Transcript_12146/g.27580 Transcript_12146/m.27580 type:complete len:249 (-) Transcript_12146:987-1733(-)
MVAAQTAMATAGAIFVDEEEEYEEVEEYEEEEEEEGHPPWSVLRASNKPAAACHRLNHEVVRSQWGERQRARRNSPCACTPSRISRVLRRQLPRAFVHSSCTTKPDSARRRRLTTTASTSSEHMAWIEAPLRSLRHHRRRRRRSTASTETTRWTCACRSPRERRSGQWVRRTARGRTQTQPPTRLCEHPCPYPGSSSSPKRRVVPREPRRRQGRGLHQARRAGTTAAWAFSRADSSTSLTARQVAYSI